MPERTLREEDADFVAAGEGLAYPGRTGRRAQDACPGLRAACPASGIATATAIRGTPDRPLVADLDAEMPGLAWDLLPMTPVPRAQLALPRRPGTPALRRASTRLSAVPITAPSAASRPRSGAASGPAGLRESTNSYRYWSPDTVIEQIDVLVNQYGVRNLKIADEMFVLNRKHVLGICDRIIERGYDLNIWAYTRVDTIKDGMLDKLKAAGFNWLAFGIEAGADRRPRQRGQGLRPGRGVTSVIAPSPGRRHQRHRQLHLRPARGRPGNDAGDARPGPGSQLRVRQLLLGDGLSRLAALCPAPCGRACRCRSAGPATRSIPATACRCPRATFRLGEVLRFRDQAFLTYYTNERYLGMLAARFGAETVAHVKHMTSYRLERDLLTGKLQDPFRYPARCRPWQDGCSQSPGAADRCALIPLRNDLRPLLLSLAVLRCTYW